MPATALVWVAAVYTVAMLAQTLSGFGFSLTSIPLLTVVVSSREAVVGTTLLGLATQGLMAWKLRAETDRDVIRVALPAALVGMPLGIAVGHVASERGLRIGVGAAVLSAVVAMRRGWTVRGRDRAVDAIAGVVSGVLATTTGTNGPPLVIGLAGRGMAPARTRATLSTLFAVANVVASLLFLLDGSVNRVALTLAAVGLAPAMAVRAAAESTFRRLDPRRYRALVLGLLTVAGLVAIVNALR